MRFTPQNCGEKKCKNIRPSRDSKIFSLFLIPTNIINLVYSLINFLLKMVGMKEGMRMNVRRRRMKRKKRRREEFTPWNKNLILKVLLPGIQSPNLMNLSRVSNPPKTGLNWALAKILKHYVEPTIFEPRLKFKSRLKFFKFGLWTLILV